MSIKSVSVYCGSNDGTNKEYVQVAKQLGVLLAENKIKIVYGGAKIGMMGAIANASIEKGGEVIGVIPSFLMMREAAHDNISGLMIVKTMAERKRALIDLADAFVILPGGIGTLDELTEVISLNQLKIIKKPVIILNINNYFDTLIAYLKHTVAEGYMKNDVLSSIIVEKLPEKVIEVLKQKETNS